MLSMFVSDESVWVKRCVIGHRRSRTAHTRLFSPPRRQGRSTAHRRRGRFSARSTRPAAWSRRSRRRSSIHSHRRRAHSNPPRAPSSSRRHRSHRDMSRCGRRCGRFPTAYPADPVSRTYRNARGSIRRPLRAPPLGPPRPNARRVPPIRRRSRPEFRNDRHPARRCAWRSRNSRADRPASTSRTPLRARWAARRTIRNRNGKRLQPSANERRMGIEVWDPLRSRPPPFRRR